jgi:hypothetical protein
MRIGKQLTEEGYEMKNPSFYVVSREEYESLKKEHANEVEGLSYDEYCALESECWHGLLSTLLESPINKAFNDFIFRNQLPRCPDDKNNFQIAQVCLA